MHHLFATELGHCVAEHVAEELSAHTRHVTALLAAKNVARTAKLHVEACEMRAHFSRLWDPRLFQGRLFLRNVLIYFDDATKTQILERVHRMLQPDGYLILGAAETPAFYSGCFGPERHGANVVYRPIPAEPRV